jgi:glutamate-1-semialdehyde 2,1-aminomutase
VVEAVQEQMAKGTHYGASHELELEWGRLVKQLVPSAERVRFVSSGTEASLMAVRLVRGYTGKKKIVKFQGHFHGWHDQVMPAVNAPFDEPSSIGLLPATLETTIVLPINDIAAVERTLAEDEDIAAVIIEAAGASTGAIPVKPGFHADLRAVTQKHNTVLIFDEVVTGFRYSPGGVQGLTGVTPDMTILAKILAGGLPGGAVVGRAEIMEQLDFKTKRRVYHPGTFNANPLSAAAGIAALKLVATGEPNRKADAAAAQLMRRWNEAIEERGAEACVYGEASFLHVYVGPQEKPGKRGGREAWTDDPNKLKGMGRAITGGFRRAMMLNGLDFIGASAIVSATHGEREIEESAAAFAKGLDLMIADGIVKTKN